MISYSHSKILVSRYNWSDLVITQFFQTGNFCPGDKKRNPTVKYLPEPKQRIFISDLCNVLSWSLAETIITKC